MTVLARLHHSIPMRKGPATAHADRHSHAHRLPSQSTARRYAKFTGPFSAMPTASAETVEAAQCSLHVTTNKTNQQDWSRTRANLACLTFGQAHSMAALRRTWIKGGGRRLPYILGQAHLIYTVLVALRCMHCTWPLWRVQPRRPHHSPEPAGAAKQPLAPRSLTPPRAATATESTAKIVQYQPSWTLVAVYQCSRPDTLQKPFQKSMV